MVSTPESGPLQASAPLVLPMEGFDDLVAVLREEGYTVIAPVICEGVIQLSPVTEAHQIARGMTDEHEGGFYRLREGDPELRFSNVVGPHGPKKYLFPPEQQLYKLHVEGDEFVLDETLPFPPKLAFLGVRPCELAAVAAQDRVFEVGTEGFRCESDLYYAKAREFSVFIAVNCTKPGNSCFCASMGTGPVAESGCDLSMTELKAGYVLRATTERGAHLLQLLPVREITSTELELEQLKLQLAREHMGRRLDTEGLVEALERQVEHPVFAEVARRCLGCGNCTMVCPTCFCSTVSDSSQLGTDSVARTRRWDSCFTHQFSYTIGGPGRTSIRGRYRHWLRHKLCTWWSQFGGGGCVGCGRCITWCPVGIDLTEVVASIRAESKESGVSP